MPTVGNQDFPYTDEGMADADMAAAGIDPMQQAAEMGLGGEELPMTMEEGEDAGRGGDVVLAHMTPGEVVIPAEIAHDPEVFEMLNEVFAMAEIDIAEFTVGDPMNKINPETGYPEFGWGSFKKKVKRTYKKITKPLKKARSYVDGTREMEKYGDQQQRQYEALAAQQIKESRKMMAEQKKFFTNQMNKFQATQAAETAIFNKKIAEEQELTRVRGIKSKRQFANTLFGLQAKTTQVSKDASAAGGVADPKDFSAPKFYGSKRTTKTAPKFKRSSGERSSSVRPR
jgi:hypothetical protein